MSETAIDVYFWPTPNGQKITLFLEEAGLPYNLHPINIGKGEQFDPEYLKISPNNKIPAIVDPTPADGGPPLAMFESGAILCYLADKIGRFIPRDLRGRCETLTWLFWQMSAIGPTLGQNHHFNQYAPEKIPYAIDRFVKETSRLSGRKLIVGEYSIAEMVCYWWMSGHERHGIHIDDSPRSGAGGPPSRHARRRSGRGPSAPRSRSRADPLARRSGTSSSATTRPPVRRRRRRARPHHRPRRAPAPGWAGSTRHSPG